MYPSTEEKTYRLMLNESADHEVVVYARLSYERLYKLKSGTGADCQIEIFTTPDCEWNHKHGEETNVGTIWLGELHLITERIDVLNV